MASLQEVHTMICPSCIRRRVVSKGMAAPAPSMLILQSHAANADSGK